LEAGGYYTVALLSGDDSPVLHTIEDEMLTNRAKALLAVYNLGPKTSVDLKTADGGTDVIVGVAPSKHQGIQVNAIIVDLGLFVDDKLMERFDGVRLQRGGVYSILVMGSETSPECQIKLTTTILDE